MKMQLTLFTLGAIATALSWTPAVDANAHGIAHHHKNRMVHEKRQSYSGKATFYNTETGNAGSCGGYLSNSGYTVALNAVQYHSGWCGKTITISANGKSHSATIQDECPGDGETCKYGALDMSPALFNYFADASVGVIDISWSVGGAVESVVNGLTGGNKNSGSSNNNSNNDNDDDDAEAKKQAAASKAAAAASRSSASAAAYASSTAAAASRSSASAAAYASSTSAAAVSASKASVAAVKSASRASVASESKASVASVHRSEASVSRASASVSRASVSSVSRASVSAEKASKSSSSVAAASASAEAARPKNLENFDAIFGGLQQLAMVAQS